MGEVPKIRQIFVHVDELAKLGIGKTEIANRFVQG